MSTNDTAAREIWRKSHGYTEEMLYSAADQLAWLLDDPRYQDPAFEPPEHVRMFMGLIAKIEAEAIRMVSAGPPYVPATELEGSFGLSQMHAFYPPKWLDFLKRMGLPDTQMTDEMLREWEPLLTEGVPLRNGNMLSNHAWSLTDPAWTLVTPYYIARLLDPSITVPFGTTPAWITVDDADEITLGLVGDMGTGSFFDGDGVLCPPDAIMAQMEKLGVDYTIHLGDVYPLGAPQFYDLFLKSWKPGRRGSFNINSNHDMYAWGTGYFDVGLKDPVFAVQRGTSYFALEFGDWIVVGIDGAYYAKPPWMFEGNVSDLSVQDLRCCGIPDCVDAHQQVFLREVRERAEKHDKKVFVLTHHHALLPDGTATSGLWDQVVSDDMLGRAPDVWYYGHIHAAAVYSEHSAAGPDTKARVFGHGAIPFAPPDEMAENCGTGKPIECYARTPYDDGVLEHHGRAQNGFAVVTLTKDGGMSERFLNQDGTDMCEG